MLATGKVVVAERSAVLVIRAWLDEEVEEAEIRARITGSTETPSRDRIETAVAGEEALLAAVADWIRNFTARR
jgi:hypothetical protein